MGVSYSPSIVTDGLVLHLDAANPKSYPGFGTTWYDMSGDGNNATLINGPTYSSDNAGVLSFDGINDYATVPSSPQWAVGQNATFESWVYFDKTVATTNHRIWCINNNLSSIDILIALSGSRFRFSAGSTYVSVSGTFPSRSWIQTTVVFNQGLGSVFFNGINQSLIENPSGINKTSTGTLFLNQYRGGGSYTFSGKTPIFRLYNKPLTVKEVQQNFNATRSRYGI